MYKRQDIVCGDIQPLGMHIQFGGGQAGFIACNQNMDLEMCIRDRCRSGSGADRGKDPGTGRRSESTIEGIDF